MNEEKLAKLHKKLEKVVRKQAKAGSGTEWAELQIKRTDIEAKIWKLEWDSRGRQA